MSRPCMLNPENTCTPDAEDKCVCAPPGADPEEWARMSPQDRKAEIRNRLLTVFDPNLRIF